MLPVAARGTGSARRRKLSPIGRSWLKGLYKPEMKMPEPTITAAIYVESMPSLELVVQHFEEHVWQLERFRSRIEDGCFVTVEGPMDRDYHFRELEVADEAGIDDYATSVMATALQRSHPLWTCTLLRAGRGRSAMLLRIHHVISDGLGLLFALLPMLKCADGDVLSKIPLPAALLGKKASGRRAEVLPPAATPSPAVAAAAPDRRRRRCCGPFTCCGNFFKAVAMFFKGVSSILFMKEDSELRCNAPRADRKPFLVYNGRRTFVRLESVPSTAIKAVRVAHGCSFNDAIMAALTGALRRYLREDLQEPFADGSECKAFMLVGLPRPVDLNDPGVSMRNKIVTPVFKLPIGEIEPKDRLHKTVSMCNDLKSAAYIMGIKLTTGFLTSILPTGLMQKIAGEAVSKGTANVTNVPLPDVPVTFCGADVKEVQCIFVNAIPQISLLSYGGHLHWNVVADPDIMPNVAVLGKYFLDELTVLGAKTSE